MYVDDSRYEKKNRSANEPIYFFTHGSRVPLQFVVNQVGKDKITGYLSVPKTATTTHSGFRQLDYSPCGHTGRIDAALKEAPATGCLFFCLLGPFQDAHFAAKKLLGKGRELVVGELSVFVEFHSGLGGLAPAALALLCNIASSRVTFPLLQIFGEQ